MSRYDWPSEFSKSPDRQAARQFRSLVSGGGGHHSGLTADVDDLDDVIQRNFDADRMWMPLGPSILTNGQARGSPIVSGRVRAIAVSPNGQRIYVGTANGGVWYSSDGGQVWTPVGSWGLAAAAPRSDLSLTVGALLVEFGATEATDIVYVATGEGVPSTGNYPGDLLGGIGILRLEGTITDAVDHPGSNPWKREARNLSGDGIFRMARDPDVAPTTAGAGSFIVATTSGLWRRSGAFLEDSNWTPVEFSPAIFSTYPEGAYCSDVVWTAQGLWVTLVGAGADDGVYHSPTGLDPDFSFSPVTLPGAQTGQRLSLGRVPHDDSRIYVLGKVPSPIDPHNNTGHAALWQVDLGHSAANAVRVGRFPVGLFVSKVKRKSGHLIIKEPDQSGYDQAIAVRMDGTDEKVTVGGSLEWNRSAWDASLFDLTVTGTAAAGNLRAGFPNNRQTNPARHGSFAGRGIHPDVHAITVAGANLWVGCDGGVFRRSGGSNRSMNAGLASAQPGYINAHPTLDGPMLAGTQDNGTIQRIGDTLWRLKSKGDGGGCLHHPTRPHQVLMQYTDATWTFEPRMQPRSAAIRSSGKEKAKEKIESKNAGFYSQAIVAPGNNADDARVFLGTDRIWYSPDWDRPGRPMHWMTIPTQTDPWRKSNAANNITQDRLIEGVDPDPVNVIELVRPGNPARKFDGMAILVLCERTVRLFSYAHPNQASDTGNWTSVNGAIISRPPGGPGPGLMVGGVLSPFIDHLPRQSDTSWTDIAVHMTTNGSETFYVSTTGRVTISAAGEITGDPLMDTLWWYNGNGRWYPTGLRNAPLDAGAGTGGCTASAHAVVVDPIDDRTVYAGNRLGVWQGRIDLSGAHPTWTWKPAMEGLPQTLVEDLQIVRTPDSMFLRAALNARGIWERDISVIPASVGRSFIRSVAWDTGRTELPAQPRNHITNRPIDYHSSPDIVLLEQGAPPWAPGAPNEADLFDVRQPRRYRKRMHDLFVMAHHRHTTPVQAAQMNIDVFLQRNAPSGRLSNFALTPQWRTAIVETVRGNSPAMPADLSHLGRIHPAGDVDARTPRAAQLAVDLNFAGRRDHLMFIAVVTSPGIALPSTDLDPADLEAVVRNSGLIAVRKIRRL